MRTYFKLPPLLRILLLLQKLSLKRRLKNAILKPSLEILKDLKNNPKFKSLHSSLNILYLIFGPLHPGQPLHILTNHNLCLFNITHLSSHLKDHCHQYDLINQLLKAHLYNQTPLSAPIPNKPMIFSLLHQETIFLL